MKKPYISIIIPAKNEESNIIGCLDSIDALEYPCDRFEVIVADNGSKDRTVEIARSKGATVFVLPDQTVSGLRNFAAKHAVGSILAFLDADCTVHKDWLKNAEKYFLVPGIACFGSPPIIPPEATWIPKTWFLVRAKTKDIAEVPWLESMNLFVPKNYFYKVGGFEEELITCEDVDLSYRLARYGKIISDRDIRVIHYGEARNLREFFSKERWRGRSNYAGLFHHGFRFDELPSLILPLYYLLMPAIALLFFIMSNWLLATICLILWQMPILSISLIKTYRQSALKDIPGLYILYNVYFLARGAAAFSK